MRSRRTRFVQVAAGLASCALVGLAVVMLPSGSSLAAPRIQGADQKQGEAKRQAPLERSTVKDGPELPPPLLGNPENNKTVAIDPVPQPPVVADPEKDADDFVARTRKEAADRIAALDKEANELRIRLAKIEAASAKLKAAFGPVGDPLLRPADPGAERPNAPPFVKDSLDPPAQPNRETLPDPGLGPDESLPRERPKS